MRNQIRITTLLLTTFAVLTLCGGASGQTSPFHYEFLASSAESCGTGTLRFFGYSYGYQSPMGWSVYGTLPYSGCPGCYLAFSWSMTDEAGGLASGSWDSRTGVSTGGTYGSSWGFSTSRLPVGELIFLASGEVRGTGYNGSPCTQSFYASTNTTVSSGGYFYLIPNTSLTYVFQNVQSQLALQIAGSSPNDYEPATQDTYVGSSNQQWRLSNVMSYTGHYDFINVATGKPLYSDFQSGNTLAYQLAGASRDWWFVSGGDGSVYIVYDYSAYSNGPRYAIEPVGGSTQAGVSIEALQRANRATQRWLVTAQ